MEDNSHLIIETQNVTRIYGDGEEIRALDGVSIKVERGELVTVMGPSGSGKSTLLNVIGALDKPTSGSVFIDGQDLSKIRDKDRFRAKTVGFMFQLHNLLPTLTAKENVIVPMMGHMGSRARKKRAEELLDLVGLDDSSQADNARELLSRVPWQITRLWFWRMSLPAAWTLLLDRSCLC